MKPLSSEIPIGWTATLSAVGHFGRGNRLNPQVSCRFRPHASDLVAEPVMLRAADYFDWFWWLQANVHGLSSQGMQNYVSDTFRYLRSVPPHPPSRASWPRPLDREAGAGVPAFRYANFPFRTMPSSSANHMCHVPVVPPGTPLAARRTDSSATRPRGSPSGESLGCPLRSQRQTWRSHTFI